MDTTRSLLHQSQESYRPRFYRCVVRVLVCQGLLLMSTIQCVFGAHSTQVPLLCTLPI